MDIRDQLHRLTELNPLDGIRRLTNRERVGLPPGSIVFTGKKKLEEIQVHCLEYNVETTSDKILTGKKASAVRLPKPDKIVWYDIRGLHDVEFIEALNKVFNIHPLVLEDVVDTNQRPKFEEYEEGTFLIVKGLSWQMAESKFELEQIAIYFGKDFVISFQEDETDTFKAVRERINTGRGRIRTKGPDYLAYALVDSVVDNYFSEFDLVQETLDKIEDDIVEHTRDFSKAKIHDLRRQMLIARKSITPLREAIGLFNKSDSELIDESTGIFVRDLYDHTIQVADIVDTYRDTLNGLQDLYISEISLQMNNVMQVLTIITTIFVPLGFLAGLYGMNFDNIPELHNPKGYYFLLGFMATIAFGLLVMFKIKKWI